MTGCGSRHRPRGVDCDIGDACKLGREKRVRDERPVRAFEPVGVVRKRSLVRSNGATRDARSNHVHSSHGRSSRGRNSLDIRRTHRDNRSIRGAVHISPAARK